MGVDVADDANGTRRDTRGDPRDVEDIETGVLPKAGHLNRLQCGDMIILVIFSVLSFFAMKRLKYTSRNCVPGPSNPSRN